MTTEPFLDTMEITHPATRYRMLGSCPNCGTFHSELRANCIECDQPLPGFHIPSTSKQYHSLVLSLRLGIEPLIQFQRAVSDERAYADMTDPGMIWIGRHDNQMGRGKGSSTRQLLPEEAKKVARLLETEPDQMVIGAQPTSYPSPRQNVMNAEGNPVEHVEITRRSVAGDIVARELALNFDMAVNFDKSSDLTRALGREYDTWCIEYASSEFPWGYTAGTTDFVVSQAHDSLRDEIWLFEMKKDFIDDGASIQVSLYVPWTVQVMMQYARQIPDRLAVHPVMIGRRIRNETAVPEPYEYRATFNSGVTVHVQVERTRYIEYEPRDSYVCAGKAFARRLTYRDSSNSVADIAWTPPTGTVTTPVERDWVRKTSWRRARQAAGLGSTSQR